ncbi:MAG: hypothetical protein QOE28_1398 [Solirubrobacteraceae bacterium]|nr:hypothetical protein [Solirubrobacteraceae bacterium]
MARRRGPAGLVVVAGLACAALPAAAGAAFPGTSLQRLSVTRGGGAGNGASRNPVISQDRRWARLAAFESDATDIVPGAGAYTNVYVVRRAHPYDANGSPWRARRTILVSRGRGGAPANGPSGQPSLSGTSRVAPRCVAFVSAASNLVAGDTNGTPDAFVRDVRTGVTRRVSVDSHGRQSRGSVSEVAVNGLCTRVAFVSGGGDLALTRARNRSWRSAVTRPSPAGRRQVYVRGLGGRTGIEQALRGLTFLASATPGGVPGDGDSHAIAFSTNSRAVTFASDAGNLTGADRNGRSDVYQRTMVRSYLPKRDGHRAQQLTMATRLVSAGPDGLAGDGDSSAPATNVTGGVVAYTTTAPALIGRASSAAQVVQAQVGDGPVRTRLASRTASGAPGNGPSADASVTAGGSWVIFDSAATDVAVTTRRTPDTNMARDAMLFTQPTGERWLLGERGGGGPTSHPRTSPHGNYVVFERGGQVDLLYVGPK